MLLVHTCFCSRIAMELVTFDELHSYLVGLNPAILKGPAFLYPVSF